PDDPDHETLVRAVAADCFEVVMVAHHMLNQSAERMIFPITRDKGIGVLIMFAVRVLFSAEGRLQKVVQKLVAEGRLAAEVDGADPLGFLVGAGGAESVIDAAYRYCRHMPGADVVLFGTGNPHHVRANVESILRPPLPAEDVTHLQEVFGALTGVGLDKPDYA
ncbi:aldo/keto reductase, partial [bacterium]|nr:aldo/keto reductase [bacterium]